CSSVSCRHARRAVTMWPFSFQARAGPHRATSNTTASSFLIGFLEKLEIGPLSEELSTTSGRYRRWQPPRASCADRLGTHVAEAAFRRARQRMGCNTRVFRPGAMKVFDSRKELPGR